MYLYNTLKLYLTPNVVDMKKLFLSICLLISSFIASAQTTIYAKPVVDERMELMGIIFRYVELPHYMNNSISTYYNEIDKYFAKYKYHPVIQMSERLVPVWSRFRSRSRPCYFVRDKKE